jgi:hypothetical protein
MPFATIRMIRVQEALMLGWHTVHTRSITIAMPCPTPMHIVARA